MNKSLSAAIIQIILAGVALLFGVLVYLLDREPENIYFIPQWLAESVNGDPFIGTLGNYLPTFVHVYAFILLTMAIVFPVQQHRRYLIPVCVFWFAVDCLFEIAQLDVIALYIASHEPTWFHGIPFLENTANYFLASTFDVIDLVSIGLGALTAYYTIAIIDNVYIDDTTSKEKQ
ncbi:hypothetical protein [Kaarinaea lacus]